MQDLAQGKPRERDCGRGCGQTIDPSRAIYGNGGILVCRFCFANEQQNEADGRVHKNALSAALGAATMGFISFFLNTLVVVSINGFGLGLVFFLFALLAIAGGVSSFRTYLRPEMSSAPYRALAFIASLIAIALGLGRVALSLLSLLFFS
jgi:hypothetical protein